MATTFSNHFAVFCHRPSTSGAHSRTVRFLETSASFRRSPGDRRHRRSLVLSYPPVARRFPEVAAKLSESTTQTVRGEEENQVQESNSTGKSLPTIKSLIHTYKGAVLSGDEKGVADIEVAICTMERIRDELLDKVTEITTDIASGKENFLRVNADFENFRKRLEKDRLSFTSDIRRELIESLLLIVDSFEKFRQQIKPETEKEKKLDTSYQRIYKQFVEIMRSLNVAVIETVGRQFDPLTHEAIARVESQKYKEGFIVEEVCRGFVLGDQILRPAKVKVSSGTGVKTTFGAEESSEQPPVAAGSDEASVSVE